MTDKVEMSLLAEVDAEYENASPARVIGRQMDEEIAAEDLAAENEAADLAYRQSPLADGSGPHADVYDYQGAHRGGVSLAKNDDTTGVVLPNKYVKPYQVEIGGYDLQTGEQIRAEDDKNGYIRSGVQKLRESITDTVAGNPPEDMPALGEIAFGVLERGGTLADFEAAVPMGTADQKRRVWEGMVVAAQRLQFTKAIEAGTIVDLGDPDPNTGQITWDSDKLPQNEEWLTSGVKIYELIEGKPFATPEGETSTPALDREEMSEYLVDVMSGFEWNTAYLVWLTARVLGSDDETKKAFYSLMNIYDNTDVNLDIVKASAGAFFQDPLTYLGLFGGVGAGAVAKQAAQVAAKNAVKHTLKRQIFKMMAKPAVAGAVLDTPIGAVEGGLREHAKQSVAIGAGKQEELDVGKIAGAATIEGVAGAGAGAVLGKGAEVAIEPAVRWGKQYLQKNNWWK